MIKMKRVSGQVTIYAALSLMLVVSLVVTCVKFARQTQMFAELDMSTRVSIESVFAGYNNKLQQEFDILALSHQQCSDDKFQYYANCNIEGMLNVNDIKYVSSCIQDKKYMIDNDGAGLEKQILLYMRNGVYSDIINEIRNLDEVTEKSETLNQITNEIMDLDEKIVVLDQSVLKLIELVEGLKTNNNGIVISNGLPELTQDGFAKQIILSDISMDAVSIYNNDVYRCVALSQDRYVNVNKLIDDLINCIELYKEAFAENNINETNLCIFMYQNYFEQLNHIIFSVQEKTRQAIEIIEDYTLDKENIYELVDKCEANIKDAQDILETDIFDSLLEEVSSFKDDEIKTAGMFLIEDMWQNLNDNFYILYDVGNELENIEENGLENIESEKLEKLREQYIKLKEKLQGISNKKLVIDYSKICFDNNNKDMGGINRIREILTKDVAEIVLSDFSLCDGSYNYNNLAQSYMSTTEYKKENYGAENISDEGLINQYIVNRFLCFTDIQENEYHQTDLWCSLGYPLEYIIAGEKSDKENISKIILKLSVLREGINMAHIITDSEKRSQAQALALSLTGFTGNVVIVKAAQFLIMGMWAYGESIVDIRRLFKGEEIDLLKTKEDWKLSLENLLLFDFNVELSDKDNDTSMSAQLKRWSEGKLNYKDYLIILLMTMNKKLKLFRVMDVMELRIIALGDTNFRMSQYVYQATGAIGVQYGDKKLCERSSQYGYI